MASLAINKQALYKPTIIIHYHSSFAATAEGIGSSLTAKPVFHPAEFRIAISTVFVEFLV